MSISLEEVLKEERKKIRKEVIAEYDGKLRRLRRENQQKSNRISETLSEGYENKKIIQYMQVSALMIDALFVVSHSGGVTTNERLHHLKNLGFSGIKIEMLVIPGGEEEVKEEVKEE